MKEQEKTKPIVRLENVSFSYQTAQGETSVLKDLSFGVEKGSFVAIVGPSGCGKSTILSLICGLIAPCDGSITFYSDDFSAPGIGYMLQHDHLLEWRTIYKNILLGLEIKRKITPENIQFVEQLLDKYNLSHTKNKRPSALSGGMRQRIALIRTLALKPDILLLDEPFSALDYQTRLNVSMDVYNIIKNENKTAILVTHDIAEAISLADTIVILSKSPCKIKKTLYLDFDAAGISRNEIRHTSLFQDYYEIIWRELENESEK